MSQRIPLDVIDIPQPCPARWEDMTGDRNMRHCQLCKTHVYNLSEMTRREAEALIEKHEGHLCARFYRRTDGTIITRRCPRAVRRAAAWTWGKIAASVVLFCSLVFASLAVARGRSPQTIDTAELRVKVEQLKHHEPVRSIMRYFKPAATTGTPRAMGMMAPAKKPTPKPGPITGMIDPRKQ